MSYLMPSDYFEFIYKAIGLDTKQTATYFRSEYLTHKEHNPDFIEGLGGAIIEFNKALERKINEMKYREQVNARLPEGTEKSLDYDNISFPISHLFPHANIMQDRRRVGKNEVSIIAEAWRIFSNKVKQIQETKEPETVNNEPLPDYDYRTVAQKISWLSELGVLQTILNRCKDGATFNWRRAANIINSFTDINPETIRKSLQAIYQPNETNKKNNPLRSPNNKIFVEEMRAKFKLNKEL